MSYCIYTVLSQYDQLCVYSGINRRCVQPTVIHGIDIPVGTTVQVDVIALHNDAEIWGPVDSNKFYPLRFSKEIKRNPLAFMGFGGGPKICIGMKFGMNEMQLAMVKILQKYEIQPTKGLDKELNFVEGFTRFLTDEVKIVLKERKY